MLTTYLTAHQRARVESAEHDVLDEPLEVRRKVGYLPENVPLYPEMRVREFLSYRAKLKDVPRSKRRAAIDHVLSRCGLLEHEDRIVGQLSKGFRQRVGLADALVNDPDLLILDDRQRPKLSRSGPRSPPPCSASWGSGIPYCSRRTSCRRSRRSAAG